MSYIDTLEDARGIGSPKKYQPYRCWSNDDRCRQHRIRPEDLDDPDRIGAEAEAMFNLGFGIETGWTRDNMLEVCRVCGTPLEIPEVRNRGQQPEYCSSRCKLDVYNARRRAARRVGRPEPAEFDLNGVYIRGVGKLGCTVAEWVKFSPEVREAIERGSQCRPREGRSLADRHRGIPRSQRETADVLTRRYGTGGPAPVPELPHDWDRVIVSWRYPGRTLSGSLKPMDANAWAISR